MEALVWIQEKNSEGVALKREKGAGSRMVAPAAERVARDALKAERMRSKFGLSLMIPLRGMPRRAPLRLEMLSAAV